MSQAAPDFTAPAQALVDICNESVEGFTAYLWERTNFDDMPAIAVGIPKLKRVPLDEAEPQLGALEYRLSFPITFNLELARDFDDQQLLVDGLLALSLAIDDDPGLRNTVFDSAIEDGQPFVAEERAVPLIGYMVRVEVSKLVQPA